MKYPKVSIIGAGNVGASAALFLLEDEVADVVLLDVVEGVAAGKALDMMHMRSVRKFGPTVQGTTDYALTAGSDLVVITAGVPRKPGMTREDLLGINSKIMTSVIGSVLENSPEAIVICVTNPLDVMTYLAYKQAGIPKNRLMGMGGVLDSARFAFAISEHGEFALDAIDEAIVIGAHGKGMLPLPRFSKVNGKALNECCDAQTIDKIVDRTVNGGGEVVSLLKTGSAFYAPASSIVRMVKAILNDTHEVMSVCALLEGEYGVNNIYMCVPCELGKNGIEKIIEFDLNNQEKALLQESAQSIAANIDALDLRA